LGFRRGGAAVPAGQPPPEPLTFSPEKKGWGGERREKGERLREEREICGKNERKLPHSLFIGSLCYSVRGCMP